MNIQFVFAQWIPKVKAPYHVFSTIQLIIIHSSVCTQGYQITVFLTTTVNQVMQNIWEMLTDNLIGRFNNRRITKELHQYLWYVI